MPVIETTKVNAKLRRFKNQKFAASASKFQQRYNDIKRAAVNPSAPDDIAEGLVSLAISKEQPGLAIAKAIPLEPTTQVVKPRKKICKQFVRNGVCKFGNKCYFSHDIGRAGFQQPISFSETRIPLAETAARGSAQFAKLPSGTANNISNQSGSKKQDHADSLGKKVYPQDPKHISCFSTTPSSRSPKNGSSIESKSSTPSQDHTRILSVKGNASEAPKPKPWNHGELLAWARANLKKTTSNCYLSPYLYNDDIDAIRKLYKSGALGGCETTTTEYSDLHFFKFLPYELREMIWGYVLCDERHVQRVSLEFSDNYADVRFKSENFAPRLLHVNWETRRLALKQYEQTFGTTQNSPQTWYNYSADCLHIQTRSPEEFPIMVDFFLKSDISRLRNIRVAMRDYILKSDGFVRAVTEFPRLKFMTLIIADVIDDEYYVNRAPKYAERCAKDLSLVWLKKYGKEKKPVPGSKKGKMCYVHPPPKICHEIVDGLKSKLYYKIDSFSKW